MEQQHVYFLFHVLTGSGSPNWIRDPSHKTFFLFHERKSWPAHYLFQCLKSCAESLRQQWAVPMQKLSRGEQGRSSQMLGWAKTALQISATWANLCQKITWGLLLFYFPSLHINQLLGTFPVFLFAALALLLYKSHISLQMLPQTLPEPILGNDDSLLLSSWLIKTKTHLAINFSGTCDILVHNPWSISISCRNSSIKCL